MKEEHTDGANAPVDGSSEEVIDKKQPDNGEELEATQTQNTKQSPEITSAEPETENQTEADNKTEAGRETEVEKLNREISEVKDKHLRLYSEFENFRRRTAKERLELINSANADLISNLLPVLDDFERAREAAEKSGPSTDYEGINLIYQKLLKELNSKGLKPMEGLEGEKFDAEIHEAISQTPAAKKSLKNRIIHVVEKGYYLNDKVLRHAKVVIGT